MHSLSKLSINKTVKVYQKIKTQLMSYLMAKIKEFW